MDDDLRTFLRQRLVAEDTIEQMEKDKIDASVIPLIGESELSQYLPSYGDRVAVMAFCRKRSNDSRKEEIINRIKGRFLGEIQGNPGAAPSTSNHIRAVSRLGNKNGEKKKRRLELGWMDYDSVEQRFKQVRASKGGGTRSLTIEKTKTVDAIRILAEAIYFPDGYNKSKKLSDYQTELKDFAQCQLDSSSTLEALYDYTKVRLLRLYLCTKYTKDADQSSRSSTSQFSASPHHASQFPATQCYALQPPASQHSASEPPASQHSASEPPASQHSALELPASQHSASEPPASQHSALELPASQHSASEPPASQHSALEPPASQHSASEPPASQHSASEPPASQHSALEPPASQHSASEPPASQHSASEPPASQHSASEPPASQHSASEPPASQHSASEPPASQHSAPEPPASQHSASEPPASQHSALELPASQHSASEPPASQHSASELPASQHSASEPPASQHSASEPPASQHSAPEPPASQHSAFDSYIYINAGTPDVFYRCFVNTSTINSTELEVNLDDTLPVILQCSSPTAPQHQTREQKADTVGERSEDGPTYTSLSDVLDDSDPEEEIEMLSPPRPDSPFSALDDLGEVLNDFRRNNTCEYSSLTVLVKRKHIFQSAITALGKGYFDWHKRPKIEFVGELAEDHGGPTREFFRLLMKEVKSIGVFEGQEGNLFFTYNQSALDKKSYYTAGRLTAWSLAHGGPGLRSLHPTLFWMMCEVDVDVQNFQCEVLPDRDVQEKLLKIQQCKTDRDWNCLRPTLEDWIADCGVPEVYGASVRNLQQIFGQVVRHFIFHRSANMMNQFIDGMNSCGRLWDTVKSHWKAFQKVFTHEEGPLTRSAFRELFSVQWSEEGTNSRDDEEDTIFSWECLNTIEEQASLSFEDLLAFVSGADAVPPLGFHKQVEIQLFDQEHGTKRFPFASTCALTVSLPRGVQTEEEVTDILTDAVRGSVGFGKV